MPPILRIPFAKREILTSEFAICQGKKEQTTFRKGGKE
jgi:hypothetical protein